MNHSFITDHWCIYRRYPMVHSLDWVCFHYVPYSIMHAIPTLYLLMKVHHWWSPLWYDMMSAFIYMIDYDKQVIDWYFVWFVMSRQVKNCLLTMLDYTKVVGRDALICSHPRNSSAIVAGMYHSKTFVNWMIGLCCIMDVYHVIDRCNVEPNSEEERDKFSNDHLLGGIYCFKRNGTAYTYTYTYMHDEY